jgi:hypothetical protein
LTEFIFLVDFLGGNKKELSQKKIKNNLKNISKKLYIDNLPLFLLGEALSFFKK